MYIANVFLGIFQLIQRLYFISIFNIISKLLQHMFSLLPQIKVTYTDRSSSLKKLLIAGNTSLGTDPIVIRKKKLFFSLKNIQKTNENIFHLSLMINLQFVFKIDATRIARESRRRGKKGKKLNLNFNWRSLSVIPSAWKKKQLREEWKKGKAKKII